MIFVTQGSEPSIGLEVFFKSFLSIDRQHESLFKLFASKSIVQKTLKACNITFDIHDDSLKLGMRKILVNWVADSNPTLNSLHAALDSITEKDTLLTLPSDKKSFTTNGNNFSGYTQFFRHYFSKPELCMAFKGPENTVALITDHIPVNEVSKIDSILIESKVRTALNSPDFKGTQTILLSGLNPHCGEGGLIGNEDDEVLKAIESLKKEFSSKNLIGPVPADTIWKHPSFYKKETLTFFMYHDQGLGVFKTRNQLIGANITYGLDFTRMSVDHGTAPDIAYTNTADYRGCLFVVKEALKRELDQ